MMQSWGWYYSDDQERWHGPYAGKEEAVKSGADDFDSGFWVAECLPGEYDFKLFTKRLDYERLNEELEEMNEEKLPEDGLGRDILMGPVTASNIEEIGAIRRAARKELEEALDKTLDEWLTKHKVERRAWAFEEMRNEERIET